MQSCLLQNKGFPASITSKVALTDVLVRIIWVNSVHHAILNFPVNEFGSYVPAIAYTLRKSPYEWTSDHAAEEIARASPENNNIFLKILPDFFVALVSSNILAYNVVKFIRSIVR